MRSTFLDVRAVDDKAAAIRAADGVRRFSVEVREFKVIPKSPMCYWAPHDVRSLFDHFKSVAATGFEPRQGLATADDFRFLRSTWETPAALTLLRWVPFAKGGSSGAFYQDLDLEISWAVEGAEVKAFVETTPGTTHWTRRIANSHYFPRPGISWPPRTQGGLRFRAMPGYCMFGHKGPAVFAESDRSDELLCLLSVTNSKAFAALVSLQMTFGSYEVGVIQRTVLPSISAHQRNRLAQLSSCGWSTQRSLDVAEVSHAFVVPAVLQVSGGTFGSRVAAWMVRVSDAEVELARVQSAIDELCFELYGISDEDRRAITEGFGVSDSDEAINDSDDEDATESEVVLDPVGLAAGLVSWAVGVAVGRFDVRLGTGERDWPVEPDPFDPLPVCSPGMLSGDDGLPLSSPPVGYPVVPSPVLVDDPGHELDLTARVRAVFDVVFGDHADVWWSDVGASLDARNGVEGWLRRGFFDQHLKTYSKSRRKAPTMWPIGTRSGSYRVWLYAHQVTGDTVFRVLGDVVEPKLASEQRRVSDLTQEFGPSPSGSQRRTLDAQQALVDELIELRDELRAVAPLWHPDLNDGIVIVLAPLWRLFAHHRAWSKELRDRWARLAKGEYDWAQLAMHIWPERVIPKCAVDRSLAIAHDLEGTFWALDDENPDKWHPRHTPTTPIVQLIADRTNPTTHTARTHHTP